MPYPLKLGLASICRLSHQCILPCFGYFQSDTSLYIVLDYCSGGDLANFIHKYVLSPRDCKRVVSQLASALVYLQQLHVAHRDVKTENVLVSVKESLQCKLADFGYAVYCPDSDFRNTLCGTLACLPPEMLESHTRHYHAMTTDVWSLGILAHELVLGEPVFAWPGNTKAMKEQIRTYRDSNLCVCGPADFSHFVASLLRRNPASRMTSRQALQHAWLTEKKPLQGRENADRVRATKRRRLNF
jgi:serine/threonine protein kinase